MKMNRKYVLLGVAALALVVIWYLNRQGLMYEGFTQNGEVDMKKLFENFNVPQKEEACKSLVEQMNMYTDILNKPANTEEEKLKKEEVTKAVEMMKKQAATLGCS